MNHSLSGPGTESAADESCFKDNDNSPRGNASSITLPSLKIKDSNQKGMPYLQGSISKEILELTGLNRDHDYYNYLTMSKKKISQGCRSKSTLKERLQNNESSSFPFEESTSRTNLSGISRIVNTKYQPNNSSSSTCLKMIGQRRVHDDGVYMLQTNLTMQESQKQLSIMENRIKRLAFEEERSRKLADLASDKATKMLVARQRHQNELLEKFKFYEERQKQQERQKQKNSEERIKRQENIKMRQKQILSKNQEAKQEISSVVRALDEIKSDQKEQQLNANQQRKMALLSERNQSLAKKLQRTQNNYTSIRGNYARNIFDKQGKLMENTQRIKALEHFEQQLLDRLKQTHSKQQKQYQDLEHIVHDGYGYYLKSFMEKKVKQDKQFCNANKIKKYVSRNDRNSNQYNTAPVNQTINSGSRSNTSLP